MSGAEILLGAAAIPATATAPAVAATSGLFGVGGSFAFGQAAMTLGSALTAVSALSSGNAARASGDYNAAIYERNATVARQQAAMDEDRHRRLAAQRMGANVAAAGASGIDLSGSVLDVLEANAAQEELDALIIRWNGDNAATGLQAQSSLARAQGRSAQTQGYVGAGASVLLGGARALDSVGYPKRVS